MYMPVHFEERDVAVMHRLMRAHPLAAVIAATPDGLDANHIPLLVHEGPGPFGTLHGHVARGNGLWRQGGAAVLVIFQGPEAFISPSWYPAKQEHGKVVPTWNYAVVHAHGTLLVIDDAASLRAHVDELTRVHETGRDAPWHVTDAPAGFIDQTIKGIVGIEIRIERLIGKWKVGQNRSDADREGAAAALTREGSAAMARLVRGERD
jgi:transcriptional regulator